jgi:hypothetical protein
VREPARVERGRTFSPVPTGTVLFITRIAPLLERGSSSTTVQTARGRRRPSTSAACRRRRTGLAPASVADVERERQPLAVPLEQLVEPGSWNGTRPACSASIRSGRRRGRHLVAELGEARARDEADPAGPEDPDLRLSLHRPEPSGQRPQAPRDREHRLVRERVSSVFTTQ